MKKLFALLTGLMIVTSVFGQQLIRTYSDIEKVPFAKNNDTLYNYGYVEYSVKNILDENSRDFSSIERVHFVVGDYLYVLAYEPLAQYASDHYETFNEGERKLYLYRKDISNINNPWIISSDVIMTNYVKNGSKDYKDVRLTTKNFPYADADIIQNKDEYTITIGVHVFKNKNRISTGLQTFTLTPAKNGFYTIKKGSETYKQIKL